MLGINKRKEPKTVLKFVFAWRRLSKNMLIADVRA